MWEVGRERFRAVSLLVGSRRGAGPFSQLLVSSLSPLGLTAEAVAALRRPAPGEAMERDKRHAQSALRAPV